MGNYIFGIFIAISSTVTLYADNNISELLKGATILKEQNSTSVNKQIEQSPPPAKSKNDKVPLTYTEKNDPADKARRYQECMATHKDPGKCQMQSNDPHGEIKVDLFKF